MITTRSANEKWRTRDTGFQPVRGMPKLQRTQHGQDARVTRDHRISRIVRFCPVRAKRAKRTHQGEMQKSECRMQKSDGGTERLKPCYRVQPGVTGRYR